MRVVRPGLFGDLRFLTKYWLKQFDSWRGLVFLAKDQHVKRIGSGDVHARFGWDQGKAAGGKMAVGGSSGAAQNEKEGFDVRIRCEGADFARGQFDQVFHKFRA